MGIRRPPADSAGRIKPPATTSTVADKEHLHISLRYLRDSHCLSKCDREDILSFADKVRLLTQKSWMELGQAHRHGLGYEKISRNSLSVSVPIHISAEVNLLAFRFSGQKSMIGYKLAETFYVLWFDREFKVYAHS